MIGDSLTDPHEEPAPPLVKPTYDQLAARNDDLRRGNDEARRIIAALTAVTGNQHAEIVRSHARIIELLKSNNEFEERARRAERKINKARSWLDKLSIGQPLMQYGKAIDHTALNELRNED